MDDITVNDGKGLFDYEGLIDTLIVDCNNLPKTLFSGQCVQFCKTIVQMVSKLVALKEGLNNERNMTGGDADVQR